MPDPPRISSNETSSLTARIELWVADITYIPTWAITALFGVPLT